MSIYYQYIFLTYVVSFKKFNIDLDPLYVIDIFLIILLDYLFVFKFWQFGYHVLQWGPLWSFMLPGFWNPSSFQDLEISQLFFHHLKFCAFIHLPSL